MRRFSVVFVFVLGTASLLFGAVTVTVHPARAPLTLTQPQQFTVRVANTTNTSVTWSVDGVAGGNSTVGTISSAGLYHPPATSGQHTITARSVAQSTSTGTATVWITNYPGMYTAHGDKYRSGVNSQELALSPANVSQSTFGKLFSRTLDGQIYAQPLIVNNLTIAGARHNVVYVATEHGSVYAIDADGRRSVPFWNRSFINPSAGVTTIPKSSAALITPEISITGTPVIDGATGTIYVAVSTDENGKYVHRLHALSLTTGAEKFGGPIVVQGSVPGTYPGVAVNGRVSFNPQKQFQRTALLLLNGVVYVAFGSFGDNLPYEGWVFAYSAQSTGVLHRTAILCTSPDAGASAIWQSGGGPAADSLNNIYVATGNGTFDLDSGGRDAGNSVLKLSPALALLDYFTPANQAQLNSSDSDLGSGGPMIAPTQSGATAPHLIVQGGKDGKVYLVNRDSMGKYNASSNSNVETMLAGQPEPTNGVFSTPAAIGSSLYLGEKSEPLELFTFANGLLSSAPAAQSANSFGYPGTVPMLSGTSGTHLMVWALDVSHYIGNNNPSPGPAVLHAYDATNLAEVYNSAQAGTRDTAGTAIKFTAPTISNGRVYVGTAKQLNVYGFLP